MCDGSLSNTECFPGMFFSIFDDTYKNNTASGSTASTSGRPADKLASVSSLTAYHKPFKWT